LGFGNNSRRAKAVSEEIIGNFYNQEISDAIYFYMASNSDAGEKQTVTDEMSEKIIAMSQLGDVVLVAVSIS
jgi:alpha-amylase/alpha-mannosidase (GH57 family)